MADFITDIAGNKRDKNGQIIGEDKVETVDRDINAWWNKPEAKDNSALDAYVKEQGNNEPISGAQGIIARGNQGDNAIQNPDAPDTSDVTKRHNEELSSLQTEENMSPATGTIVTEIETGSEVKPNVQTEQPRLAGAYNVGESDADSIEQGGKDTYNLAKEILDSNNPYKSGADYVKYLWSQGAGGKARALANVLGNVLQGVGGKKTQWEDFTENYQKQEREARETAMSDAMNAIKTANQNQAVRTELVKSLNQAISKGTNLSPSEMAAIQQWQTATTPSSALDKAIASIFAKLGIALDNIPTLGKGK